MTVSIDLFKEGMRMLAGSVTLITVDRDGVRAGLTATAICSLSAEPPRLLCCVNRNGATYQMIAQQRSFCVNILSAEQTLLARTFASPMAIDKFADGEWSALKTGAPVLESALASFDCNVGSIMDTGSHAIIVGEVRAIRKGENIRPLIYCDGNFIGLSCNRSISE